MTLSCPAAGFPRSRSGWTKKWISLMRYCASQTFSYSAGEAPGDTACPPHPGYEWVGPPSETLQRTFRLGRPHLGRRSGGAKKRPFVERLTRGGHNQSGSSKSGRRQNPLIAGRALLRPLAQGAAEPFARLGGEPVRRCVDDCARALTRGLVEETNLLSVAPAPLAYQQVKPEPDARRPRQRPVEGIALQFADLATGRHERSKPCLERGGRAFQKWHVQGVLSHRKPATFEVFWSPTDGSH